MWYRCNEETGTSSAESRTQAERSESTLSPRHASSEGLLQDRVPAVLRYTLVMAALIAMASSIALAVNNVSPETEGRLKANAELHFKATPLQKLSLQSDFTRQSRSVDVDANGRFSVGQIKEAGAFTVKVSDADNKNTRVWLALVSRPELVKGDFVVDWVSLGTPDKSISESVANRAIDKVLNALVRDPEMRADIWREGSARFLNERMLDVVTTASTCVLLNFVPGIGTATCIYAVVVELANFLRYVVEEAVDRLNKAGGLTKNEHDSLTKLLAKARLGTRALELGKMAGRKPSDILEGLGTIVAWAAEDERVQELIKGTLGGYEVQIVRGITAKYSIILRVIKL